MRTSESITNILKAITAFQKEEINIFLDAEAEIRTKTGYSYKFKYATLPNIMSVIKPLLLKHGIIVMQPFSNGNLYTILMHESGEFIETEFKLPISEGMDKQMIGSLITYFRRYMLTSLLGLVAEEDDDANIADGNEIINKKENKPVMTETQFRAIQARILKGEDIINKVKEHFKLTPEQIKILDELNKNKNNNQQ